MRLAPPVVILGLTFACTSSEPPAGPEPEASRPATTPAPPSPAPAPQAAAPSVERASAPSSAVDAQRPPEPPGGTPEPSAEAPEMAREPPTAEAPATTQPPIPTRPRSADPVEAARVPDPYALPRGGAVADAGQRVETVRQMIDALGQKALLHAARMRGDQPGIDGSTDVDLEAEKERYLAQLRATHRSMRKQMHVVARCPDADPERPVANRSAPVNALAREIERYVDARPTAREADAHVEKLRPLVVAWKSVYIDPAAAREASRDDWSVPRELKQNWCP